MKRAAGPLSDGPIDGSVVVGRSLSGLGIEAFRWTAGGGMVGIGGGSTQSLATDASADGSVVVGHSFLAGVTASTFIWDAGNGMRNLQDVLINDFGLGASLSGWTLTKMGGISDDGLTIVGSGTNPSGLTEAWIANLSPTVIPEPSSFVIWGIVTVGMIGYRRRRRRLSRK